MLAKQLAEAAIYAGDGVAFIWCNAKGQGSGFIKIIKL
jgi:hypothetical protein